MKADALARLCRIASGARLGPAVVTNTPHVTPRKPAVTPDTPVTPLRAKVGKAVRESDDEAPDLAEIEERAGLASDTVPALYLDAWARLNCQKPTRVSEAEWRLALNDGGLFLDAWGDDAAALDWTPGALFDVASGLVWRLGGERVEAFGVDHARLSDGRVVMRGEESQ